MAENPEQPEGEENLPYADALTNIDIIAIQINEMFSALKRAGFAENQALHLSGMMLGAMAPAPLQDDPYYDEREFEDEDLDIDIDLDADDDGLV